MATPCASRHTRRGVIGSLLLVLLLAAAPLAAADWLQSGNDACKRGDFEEALTCYQQAEQRTTEPGLVAYNKAFVLYQLRRFREAELHYRRSLADAEGERRARALLGLGDSLLERVQGKEIEALRDAAHAFQLCREMSDAPAALRDDAEHNLELTRLLLARALAEKPSQPDNPPNSNNPDQPPKPQQPQQKENPQTGTSDTSKQSSADKGSKQTAPTKETRSESKKTQPRGDNSLPALQDEAELKPLPPEDTARHLERIAERILQERRAYWRAASPVQRNVKDW